MVLGHSLASVGVEWFGCEYIYAMAGAWLELKVIFAVALGIKGFPSHALALAGLLYHACIAYTFRAQNWLICYSFRPISGLFHGQKMQKEEMLWKSTAISCFAWTKIIDDFQILYWGLWFTIEDSWEYWGLFDQWRQSRTTKVNRGRSRIILDYLGLPWFIKDYLGLLWFINFKDYHGLFRTLMDYQYLF